jgi:hypothetical protein
MFGGRKRKTLKMPTTSTNSTNKNNDVYIIDNLFSPEELDQTHSLLLPENLTPKQKSYPFEELGRLQTEEFMVPESVSDRLLSLVRELTDSNLEMSGALYVKYSLEYGQPNLNPHFDGDRSNFIVDYQLGSNTIWPLGVNLDIYPLKDNQALLFNPNENIHWRPRKTFNLGEYVEMLFFRFYDPEAPVDYSYLPHHPDDPAFTEVRTFRDGLDI